MAGGGEEASEGLVHGLVAEAEGVVVHWDHGLCSEVDEGLERFFGTGVDGAIAVRGIGSDGEQGDVGVEAAGDFLEAGEEGGIAGMVDGGRARGGEDVSAEAAMGIAEFARAPVAGGGGGDGEGGSGGGGCGGRELGGLPPFEGANLGEAEVADEVLDAVGDDGDGGGQVAAAHGAEDGAEGGEVEVVHVGVGEEDRVDGGKVAWEEAGAALAAEEDEAGGEDGVDEEGAAGGLDEEGGVSDEGDGGVAGGDGGRGAGVAGEGVGVAFADHVPELGEFFEDDGEGCGHCI